MIRSFWAGSESVVPSQCDDNAQACDKMAEEDRLPKACACSGLKAAAPTLSLLLTTCESVNEYKRLYALVFPKFSGARRGARNAQKLAQCRRRTGWLASCSLNLFLAPRACLLVARCRGGLGSIQGRKASFPVERSSACTLATRASTFTVAPSLGLTACPSLAQRCRCSTRGGCLKQRSAARGQAKYHDCTV